MNYMLLAGSAGTGFVAFVIFLVVVLVILASCVKIVPRPRLLLSSVWEDTNVHGP